MAQANWTWRAWWLALAAALALGLAACGGGDAPRAAEQSAGASAASAASPSPTSSGPAERLFVTTPTPTASPTATNQPSPTATPTAATATADAVTPPPAATSTEAVDAPETPEPASPSPSSTEAPETPAAADRDTVTISGDAQSAAVHVEYAATEFDRAHGLMGRPVLPDTEGMLFIFPRIVTGSFWMKNTPNPLDIAFIAADGTVLNVAHGQPFDLTPLSPASPYRYVLEVAGGWFARMGLGPGAAVTLPGGMPDATN